MSATLPVATPVQPDGEMILSVTLPPGAQPGHALSIAAPDGRMFEIVVPPNCYPGQTINVVVDGNVTSGSSTHVADVTTSPVQPTDPKSNRAVIGAAAAAAVTGALLVGPVTGVCVAGAAVYASTRNDEVGDMARKIGAGACYAYDTAKKHGVFDKIKSVGQATIQKANEVNREYHLTERASAAVTDFDREHKVTERVTQGAMTAVAKTPGAMSALLKMATNSGNSEVRK